MHAGLSFPALTLSLRAVEGEAGVSATVREVREAAGAAHCAGTTAAHLGKLGGRRWSTVRAREEGAFRGWDGIWIHLIRSEE